MELLKATRHFHSNSVDQGGSHPSSLAGGVHTAVDRGAERVSGGGLTLTQRAEVVPILPSEQSAEPQEALSREG